MAYTVLRFEFNIELRRKKKISWSEIGNSNIRLLFKESKLPSHFANQNFAD